MDMSSVIAFESGTPEQELAKGAVAKFDYSQVEGALRTDLETAENVFARCAKKQLRQLLGDVALREELETLPVPVWLASVSVTLPLVDGKLDHSQLAALTLSLATTILMPKPSAKLVMVGALNVRLLQVGVGLFTFGLRQKWGIE